LSGDDDAKDTDASTETTPPPKKPQKPVVDPDSLTPQPVAWSFETTPKGAKVTVDGRRLCEATPCTADLDARKLYVTVYFALPGYRDMSKSVVPESDERSLSVVLQPLEVEEEAPPEAPIPDDKKKKEKGKNK